MKSTLLSIILLLVLMAAKAQFYNSGQNRGNTHWKQIDTLNLKLVYPDYAEKVAQKFANDLQWATENVGKSLGHQASKIEILMQMESSTSNAMVVWAPKRMEVHALQPQDGYAQDWFQQLALHEYRHVVQIDKLNQSWAKLFYYFFGQMGTSALIGAYLPTWYLEGDAVETETQLSQSGRGRQSYFSMPLRAQLLEEGAYTFDKATMGSYKDFVPDHYTLGYQLVSFGKMKFGDEIWQKTQDYIAQNPFEVVSFNNGLKQQSGLTKRKFYQQALDSLQKSWAISNEIINYKEVKTPTSKHYTSYQYPALLNEHSLISYENSMNRRPRIVLTNLKKNKTKKLLSVGYGQFQNLTLKDSVLCYTEKRIHSRWQKVQYEVLMRYDFKTKKKIRLSRKTHYYYPSLNDNATQVAVLNQSKSGAYSIEVLDVKSGKNLQTIPLKNFVKHHTFTHEGNLLWYELTEKGWQLTEYQLESKSSKSIGYPTYSNVGRPLRIDSNHILYIDDIEGIANIYQLQIDNSEVSRVSSVKYGVDFLSSYNNEVYFNDYTAQGWKIRKAKIQDLRKIENAKLPFASPFMKSDIDTSNIQGQVFNNQIQFSSRNYSKFLHLFKFHSWAPLSINIENADANFGFSVMSQNLLSTSTLEAGYKYLYNKGMPSHNWYANYIYEGFNPIFKFGVNYQTGLYSQDYGKYNSPTYSITISEPLRFLKSKHYFFIQPEIGLLGGKYNFEEAIFADESFKFRVLYGDVRLGFTKLRHAKDLFPRWGLILRANSNYNDIIGDHWAPAINYLIQGNLFIPGIGRHHNLRIQSGYEYLQRSFYQFGTSLMPYGYQLMPDFPSFSEIFAQRFQYDFTLAYPDLSLGSILYIKRINTSLFFNPANIWESRYYTSSGLEMHFESHILRLPVPVDLGIRAGYFQPYDQLFVEFLFSASY